MRLIWPFPEPEKVRVDAAFLDPAYPEWRKKAGLPPAEHPGADLNLQGTGGDGDLGYPVVAIAEGRVVHARAHRVWGNIVLVEHDLPIGRFWSQYAHLLWMVVREGQWVMAGEPVGAIGKGDPTRPFLAHLHWEIRRQPIPADAWPGTNRDFIRSNYLDPVAFVRQNYEPARRYFRMGVVLFNPTRQELGAGVVNLESPDVAQVAIRRPIKPEKA